MGGWLAGWLARWRWVHGVGEQEGCMAAGTAVRTWQPGRLCLHVFHSSVHMQMLQTRLSCCTETSRHTLRSHVAVRSSLCDHSFTLHRRSWTS